jgi:hypothetical protein
LASESKALGSPRNAFCDSNGMRCTTNASCSPGAATGEALRVNAVRTAARPMHSTTSPASTGRAGKFDVFSIRLVDIFFSTI